MVKYLTRPKSIDTKNLKFLFELVAYKNMESWLTRLSTINGVLDFNYLFDIPVYVKHFVRGGLEILF